MTRSGLRRHRRCGVPVRCGTSGARRSAANGRPNQIMATIDTAAATDQPTMAVTPWRPGRIVVELRTRAGSAPRRARHRELRAAPATARSGNSGAGYRRHRRRGGYPLTARPRALAVLADFEPVLERKLHRTAAARRAVVKDRRCSPVAAPAKRSASRSRVRRPCRRSCR